MAHFAQPHSSVRAPRVRVPHPEPISFSYEEGTVQGVLKKISVTGGLVCLPRQIRQGTFAEVRVRTISGPVNGLVEMLDPRIYRGSPEQGFRFVAMSDDDHDRLAAVLEEMKRQGVA